MPRKLIRGKKKNHIALSPMRALILKAALRRYTEELTPESERVLYSYCRMYGVDPEKYIRKENKKGE